MERFITFNKKDIMKIKAAPGYILVKEIEREEDEGLYIPSQQQEIVEAVVVSCGEAIDSHPCPAKDGDTIFYTPLADSQIEHNDEKYIVIRFNKVIARME